MLIAHKIALDPNKAQREYFARAAGAARCAWNWALSEWQRQYKAGEKPCEVSLRKKLNSIKREQFPWMYDVTKCAAQESVIDLGTAFDNFLRDCKKPKKLRHLGYPRFKSRESRKSFCAANEEKTFRVFGKKLALPIIGTVRVREKLRFSGTPKRVTVSCEAGRWFASILVDTHDIKPVGGLADTVGIDLGINTLAATAAWRAAKWIRSKAPRH